MMSVEELVIQNIPNASRREKTICHSCGNLVDKQNYCPICDNVLGDN